MTGNGRHHALDLVRGFAAIGVLVYHFASWGLGVQIESLGAFAVYLFFVLSAVTMMMVYGQRFNGAVRLADVLAFFRHRAARILPLLAAVAAASFAFNLSAATAGFWPELARALLTGSALFSLQLPGFLSNTTGAWSLGIEVAFYLVFPLVALLAQASSTRQLAIAMLILLCGQQLLLWLLRGLALGDFAAFWNFYATPIVFAPFFAAGVLAHRLQLPYSLANLAGAVALMAAVGSFSLFVTVNLYASPAVYVVLSAATAVAVWLGYSARVPAGLAWLSGFLGDISYALYLTHPLTFAVAIWGCRTFGIHGLPKASLVFAGAIAVSFLVFALFERPARDALR